MLAGGRHFCLQRVVEHVADHQHAATHPLTVAAEIGVIDLRLGSAAANQRVEQGFHRLAAQAGLSRYIGEVNGRIGHVRF